MREHLNSKSKNKNKYKNLSCPNCKFKNIVKKGLIHLIADPIVILRRRNKSKKEFGAYPTKKYLGVIVKELDDEENYLTYFIEALGPDAIIKTIDTSKISIVKVSEKIGRMYNEM
jgi:hypothetical protein